MKKKIVLSLNPIGHDTAASILINGEIIAACEQERFSKDKHSTLFPIDAVKECLRISKVRISDLDLVVVPWLPNTMIKEYYLKHAIVSKKRMNFLINDLESVKNLFNLEKTIKEKLKYNGPVKFFQHHLCHLYSSYYCSGFNEALVVSYDGAGENETMAIAIAKNNSLKVVESNNYYPHSLGLLYAAVTFYLGWKHSCDEGIVMGLASLGDYNSIIPNKKITYYDVFKKILVKKNDYEFKLKFPDFVDFFDQRNVWVGKKFYEYFGPKRKYDQKITKHHMNIASALQKRIEDIIISHLKRASIKYKKKNLCISGGVGLNCSLNGKIYQKNIFNKIFVVPPSGDQGTNIGACFLGYEYLKSKIKIKKRFNFYLGSRFSDNKILSILKKNKIKNYYKQNVYIETAKRLRDGKIIAWFQDGAEFGPRALGNRSILTKPFPLEMKDHLNSQVKFRESFRPFAPAVIDKYAKKYFQINQDSPHMLIAFNARKRHIESIAATVHTDNTSRVQTVSKKNNLKFWQLLDSFYNITGIPVLLNTSFNVKGQPIVNTPQEAIDTFLSTKIDTLVIGNYIIDKK